MNRAINNRPIAKARQSAHQGTSREALTDALNEYVQHRKQRDLLVLFGTIDYNNSYDCKRERRSKRT